jgi:hypothetical protein
MPAAMQLAVQDDARPEARPDREEHEVLDASRNAEPALPERGEVDVVLDGRLEPEHLLDLERERHAVESDDARHVDAARLGVDDTGNADDSSVEEVAVDRSRGDERIPQFRNGAERLARICRTHLDVVARLDLAPQVADRSSQEARSEVQPEHESGVRDGLEEDRSIARPARVVVDLADEACAEERLERE